MTELKTPLQVIEILRDTSSTLAKQEILEKVKLNTYLENRFKRLIDLTYNPYINFYIKKLPKPTTSGVDSIFDTESLHIINRVINREITGNGAINELSLLQGRLTSSDQQLLQLMLSRSFDCGVSAKTINKVWPELVPEFSVMLCSPLNDKTKKKIKWPAYVQIKYDASRVVCIVKGETVTYTSRNGKALHINNTELDAEMVTLAGQYAEDGVVFDGEIMQRNTGRVDSNKIATKFVRDTASQEESGNVHIVYWDLIPLDKFSEGVWNKAYSARFELLRERYDEVFVGPGKYTDIAENREMESFEEANKWCLELMARGEEGIIIKNKDSKWVGRRSPGQFKVKEELESELKIVDIVYGQGKYSDATGALQCESSDGLVKVSVGSGLTDEDRTNKFHPDNKDELLNKIVTIRHNGIIEDSQGDYSLYLPRFIELREDKDVADDLTKIKNEGQILNG